MSEDPTSAYIWKTAAARAKNLVTCYSQTGMTLLQGHSRQKIRFASPFSVDFDTTRLIMQLTAKTVT